ncbi:hypothetical protein [Bradyrhizobium elkanii]|uniref:hypothetical protein n=1 Tax=Bradyrhizobium elkanii TaxID=29448 RepID=UPI0008420635|nr:hypothetical protein [Bradyrhizobium elkanii]ODM71721.1 hypothetical protein A6X20_07200 [Bradyrhizobium elkanii]ODM79094.1 hypothetical protein A6452_28785 [Bradyrhizobium elkanii]
MTMFDFVEPHDGPVIIGLEKFETVYAKDQPQYRPLRTLPSRRGDGAIARFHFTDAQRKAIVEGADLYLELLHFKGPLAPSLIMVMSEPADTDVFRSWWKAQTSAPYQLDVAPKTEAANGPPRPSSPPSHTPIG